MVGRPDWELCEISLKAALLWPSSSIMTCRMPSSAAGPLITGLIHGSLIAATDWIKRSSLLLETVKKQTRLCLPQFHSSLAYTSLEDKERWKPIKRWRFFCMKARRSARRAAFIGHLRFPEMIWMGGISELISCISSWKMQSVHLIAGLYTFSYQNCSDHHVLLF